MPRPRSPERDKSYEIYKSHNGNIENRRIAELVNKDERLIAKWKHEDAWVQKLKKNKGVHLSANSVHQTSKRNTQKASAKKTSNIAPKKRVTKTKPLPSGVANTETKSPHPQARPGNKNAVGNRGGKGAPPQNKQALKTGEYEAVFFNGIVDEDELSLLEVEFDKYTLQFQLIKTLTIRERRIMMRIQELKTTPGGMVFASVTKQKSTSKIAHHNDSDGKQDTTDIRPTLDTTSHVAQPILIRVMELEDALTRVQGRKQAAINQLHKMQMDDDTGERSPVEIAEAIHTLIGVMSKPVPNRSLPQEEGAE